MILHDPWDRYLEPTLEIDFHHPSIARLIEERGWNVLPEFERVRSAYRFVRDEVRHSWDAQDNVVTCCASEVLAEKTGICYAKSHLLAALLRAMGTPAGICYQRLVLFEDPADGYSLHSLNAAYFSEAGIWARFDARGNRPGIEAELDLECERLAFAVRPEMDEIDYPGVYAVPPNVVVECLRVPRDAREMYERGLPDHL